MTTEQQHKLAEIIKQRLENDARLHSLSLEIEDSNQVHIISKIYEKSNEINQSLLNLIK